MFQTINIKNMKHIIVFLGILLLISNASFSQDKKFTMRTGVGFYADAMGRCDGPVIWLEGGYKFNTGFYLNGRLSMASIDWTMSGGFYEGYKTIALRQMADITFSRPIKLKGQHFLEPGLGFKLKREYNLYPDLAIQNISGETIIFTRYSQVFYEIGITICLDYYYEFKSNFYMGLRADTNLIWAIGLEGITFSPLFGFRF